MSILEIPELVGLDSRGGLVRIPPEWDVPLTARVRKIIDTPPFRRLARISQLGLVSLVYPAAHHTRFEHSLGVYRLALLLLKRLAYQPRFTELVSRKEAELLIVASLLHDIGHWPFCHPLEDIRLPELPNHESAAQTFLLDGELADVLRRDWEIEPEQVVALLNKAESAHGDPCKRLLSSILSGPIDIDKMDYLFRDSLHAGVPYGRHFDQNRLIASLCLNEAGDALAISDKGKTAAELMVFARYVMFNEVYWHHGVRTATAMLQRAFYLLLERLDLRRIFLCTEQEMIDLLKEVSRGTPAWPLVDGLFGERRRLYKRLAQLSVMEQPKLYRKFAGRPYSWLCGVSEKMYESLLSEAPGVQALGVQCSGDLTQFRDFPLLIDSPPTEREVELRIDVYYPKEEVYRSLESVSPVVRSLAREQFDDYVKRVRIFAPAEIVQRFGNRGDLSAWVAQWVTESLS